MVIIEKQFNGPDNSGNGGYVAGLIASQLPDNVPVRTSMLRMPPPLESPLDWSADDETVSLVQAPDAVIGTSTAGAFAGPVLDCPTVDEAATGLEAYPGFHHHPFDRCFTCGTQRAPGDGLRLFTGPIGDSKVAAPWTAHPDFGGTDGRISVPVMWAALDCPGGWAADFTHQPMVLGKMTAEVSRLPLVNEPCLSVGGIQRTEGRKFFTNTALYAAEGELLGRAEQIWIAIDLKDFS